MSVYEPSEDTWLLEESIRRLRGVGLGIEVGCGSGYIADALSSRSREVVAIDIDPGALMRARQVLGSRANIHLIQSDCLGCMRSDAAVDVVVSNPPYLPDDEEMRDSTIHGGPSGAEIALRILEQSRRYIERGGRALIVSSSLGGVERIRNWAAANGLSLSVTASRRIFFEEIMVLEITRDAGRPRLP